MAPTFVSGTPTGTLTSRYADLIATFDDTLYRSAKFVKIYEKDSTTPLAVYRYAYGKRKKLLPKKSLKPGTRYRVEVTTGVNDGINKLRTAKAWSFKTRG